MASKCLAGTGTTSEKTSNHRHDPRAVGTNLIALLAGRDQRLHVHPSVGRDTTPASPPTMSRVVAVTSPRRGAARPGRPPRNMTLEQAPGTKAEARTSSG
jgi:hypothetical protein